MTKNFADWPHLTQLFLRYRSGDEAATLELFQVLEKVFNGFFHVRMSNSADIQDMVQTTMLKVHFGRDSFNEALSLKTWIFTIANRALIDHWRVGAKDRDNILDIGQESENIESEGLPLDDLFAIHSDLTGALNKLKPFERSIVYLYGIEGMSMSEIAVIHGSTEGAIKVRVHRAYQQLKSMVAE